MTEYRCNICNKLYYKEHWYHNHLYKVHNIAKQCDVGWDKKQLELAMELSMKEQFKKYIPDDDEVLEMSNAKVCTICMCNKAEIATIPCGHVVTCQNCVKSINSGARCNRKCPLCRKKIDSILRVYL